MIGLDTNVLVCYIVRDDPADTALADRCIEHIA
jgi:predicted nucleic-acid-binding protein